MKKVMIFLLLFVCSLFISPHQTEAVGLSLNEFLDSSTNAASSDSFLPSLENFFQKSNSINGAAPYSSIQQNILTNVTLTDGSNNEFTDENRPTLNQATKIHFDWSVPDALNVQDGDTYTFMIPNVFKIYTPITGTLGEYGSFSVGTDGTVVMTFNENTQESSNVHGTLDFSTYFDSQKLIGNTMKLLYFPIQETKIFVVNFIPSSGTLLSKSGVTDKSYNPKQINWTVRANGNKSFLKVPTLKDSIPDGLTLLPNSVQVYRLDVYTDGTSSVGSIVDPTLYDVLISETGELTVTLNASTINAYQINYSTTINDLSKTSFTNTVNLSAQNLTTTSTTSKVTINRSKHINKYSSYTQKNQKIDWTIEYNYNTESIPVEQTDFTDYFSNAHVLVQDSIEVRKVSIDGNGNATVGALVPSGDYVVTSKSTASTNGFNLSFNYAISDAYQIVYDTVPAKDLLGNQSIINQVTSPFGIDKTASASRSIQQGNIMKSVIRTDYSKKRISWQEIINNNNYVMDSPFLKDRFSASGLTLDDNTLIVTDTTQGNKILLKDTDYIFTKYLDNNGFTIEFIGNYKNNMTSTLKVTYDTAFDYSKLIGKTYFENTATMTWTTDGIDKTSSMIASVSPGNYTKDNGFKKGSYDAVKKELTWTVGANYNLYPINQLKITDTWDATHQLVPASVEVHKMKLSTSQNGYSDGGVVDPNTYTLVTTNQSVSVSFKAPTLEAYYLVYKTKSSNNMLLDHYSNTVTLSDGNQLLKTYTANVTIPYGGAYVNKTATQSGDYVNWKLAINEGQSTIRNARIIDEPSQNQVIVESSIHLYDTNVQTNGTYSQGSELVRNKDYYVNITTNSTTGKQTMTLTFAKDLTKPYLLAYQTIIDANDQDTLTNTVTLSGWGITTENVKTVSNIVVNVSGGSGTGTGERGMLSLKKVAEGNNQQVLPGVEFKLYDKTGVKLYRTGTTDNQGNLQFGGLRYGSYLLKETKAAEGYLVSSELIAGKTVTLDKADNPLTLTNKLDVGSAELVLADLKTKTKMLPGANYRLVDEKGTILQSNLITDAQGKIHVDDLKPGNYHFIETTAPNGYARDGNAVKFTIVSNNKGPVSVTAFNDISQEAKMNEGKIFVHKLDFPEGTTIPSISGNGEVLSQLPENAKSVAGVEVAVVEIEGDTLGETPSLEEAYAYYDSVKDRPDIAKDTGITDSNGIFETKILPAKRYLIIDIQSEAGTTKIAAPVIISLPMMKADGTGWNNEVHVYTKNAVLLGAAKIQKVSDTGTPISGGVFTLYKVSESGTDEVVLKNLTSKSDGYTDIVGNLVLGDYYYLETRAPSGYFLSQEKVHFSITMDDQAYDSKGKLITSKVKVSSLKNYKQPSLTKVRLTDPSTDLGKTVSWKITTDVPKNIASYNKYFITDTLDSRLDYVGNLQVLADGVRVSSGNYSVTINERKLTITFIDTMNDLGRAILTGKKKIEITFDTTINSTVVPGVAIPNNALLTMNNGYTDATATEANPPNVQTGGRKFVKQNSTNQPLAKAEFIIYKTVNSAPLYLVINANNRNVTWSNDKAVATKFISGSDGTFEAFGLTYGTYYLEETKAPKGFNLLNGPKPFVIDNSTYTTNGKLVIINSNSPVIPITGGMGTLIFFVTGIVFMGAAYYFYSRREYQSETRA